MMKKIRFMDVSFRDGFQSCYGARVRTEDFIPALEAAADAGLNHFEIGGGARFQSLYFYCQEDAFAMMDACREAVGPDAILQTLARGINVVGLVSQSRDIINLHAKLFKKHGVTTIRNFDALLDTRNLAYSGKCIADAGLNHQVVIALMGLPPGLKESYCHTSDFYLDKLKEILDSGLPYHSVAFKDASGTTRPTVVHETIKKARKLLGEDTEIHFHTHDTAGLAVACNLAAIEAGADLIDLSMAPVSGGTAAADIITMWYRLQGTGYTLDIDPEKILEVEALLHEQMKKYYLPPESKEVNPMICFSPMPGGALTANTQMMRDNNSLHLFPEVIKNMRDVVAKGGFGSSVTPVSQFYFQQAFMNTIGKPWDKISESYGKMVLGYFGRTPAKPDPEIIKLASEQLGLQPTEEDIHDLNDANPDLGIEANQKILEKESLPVTDENIFISAACGAKGIAFLKGNAVDGIRWAEKEKPEKKPSKATPTTTPTPSGPANYTVTVNGMAYQVQVEETSGQPTSIQPAQGSAPAPQAATASKPSGGEEKEIKASMPGSVLSIDVDVGEKVTAGQKLLVLEAMKMESPVTAPGDGTIGQIEVTVGDTVANGDLLLTLRA
ncbi:MAG: hypothetical protein LAT58_12980 [Opitutales bacterium]|nr:hypothetical protein [Opitutales bacterium]